MIFKRLRFGGVTLNPLIPLFSSICSGKVSVQTSGDIEINIYPEPILRSRPGWLSLVERRTHRVLVN